MTGLRWYLAVVAHAPIARGGISEYRTATEAAHAAVAVLHSVADCLRAWAAVVGAGDERAGHARRIADRLVIEAADITNAETEDEYAANLDDANLASIPLNTMSLPENVAGEAGSCVDPPIPFGASWGEQPVRLHIWIRRSGPTAPAVTGTTPPTRRKRHAMAVFNLRPGQAMEPAAGTDGSVRRWVSDTIAAGVVDGCPACRTRQPCPAHAADAILDACRQERLFIMPSADADAIIDMAVARHVGASGAGTPANNDDSP